MKSYSYNGLTGAELNEMYMFAENTFGEQVQNHTPIWEFKQSNWGILFWIYRDDYQMLWELKYGSNWPR